MDYEERPYDFSGWATKNDIRCSDGRTIRKNAFIDDDGCVVPLVYNHSHSKIDDVLGHALLENRPEGVYCYGWFNEDEEGLKAKERVRHGDIKALSIYANKLKEKSGDVFHGKIREVSLVLAGANPGAFIDNVIAHSDDDVDEFIFDDPELFLNHSDDEKEKNMGDSKENESSSKTVEEIIETMNEEQKKLLYTLVGMSSGKIPTNSNEGENKDMKQNAFDRDNANGVEENALTHSDEMEIINLAKTNSVGSLRDAMAIYSENTGKDVLAHGFQNIDQLFPEYKNIPNNGAPELITRDESWVGKVMSGTSKSPITRIRTRQMDARGTDLRALGYKKGDEKTNMANVKLLKRETDPQTVYIKDMLNRDDILDITDFDVVAYQYNIMKMNLNEELARAIMVGDGREEGDDNKISESHIRSIWHDDELYTIHQDVDITAAKASLQGTDTSKSFGDNYVYAEAIIQSALYSREKYKGSGALDFYCTPHLLNVMLLARDMNGRRIYDSVSDLASALNVKSIITVEQFEGLTRTTTVGNKTKKLLGIFVNLKDYQVGATKGGEITRFEQFDIDFNQNKYLIETRLSGALTRIFSAIALEEDVTPAAQG